MSQFRNHILSNPIVLGVMSVGSSGALTTVIALTA